MRAVRYGALGSLSQSSNVGRSAQPLGGARGRPSVNHRGMLQQMVSNGWSARTIAANGSRRQAVSRTIRPPSGKGRSPVRPQSLPSPTRLARQWTRRIGPPASRAQLHLTNVPGLRRVYTDATGIALGGVHLGVAPN